MNHFHSVLSQSPKRTTASSSTKWSSMVAIAERLRRTDPPGGHEPEATVAEMPGAKKSVDCSPSPQLSSAKVLGGLIPISPVVVSSEQVRMFLARRAEFQHRRDSRTS